MEVNAECFIWLINVLIFIAALFIGAMSPIARGNRATRLVGDLPVIALGSISVPPRYSGALG